MTCKFFIWMLIVSGLTVSLTGGESKRFVALCSTTQTADFTRQIVGDHWEVRCVLSPGQDPHMYRVTPNDLRSVRDADLCIENGLHLEGKDWMKTLAKDANKPLVSCTDGVKPILLPGGESVEIRDPHAWFSPLNAAIYIRNITLAVSNFDQSRKDEYQARAELYLAHLRTLDTWIKKQCNAIPKSQRILVTSHDAFNYFCQTYGFESASPVGWSTGQEIGSDITFQRRRETIDAIKNMQAKAIFVETTVNPKVIEEMAKEAGVVIGGELYSDSMGEAGSAGESYLGMMRENVMTIVRALK